MARKAAEQAVLALAMCSAVVEVAGGAELAACVGGTRAPADRSADSVGPLVVCP
jgi:hypothetical protein